MLTSNISIGTPIYVPDLKIFFEVDGYPINTCHPNALGTEPAPVVAGGPLGTSTNAAGCEVKVSGAVVIILVVEDPSIGAGGINLCARRMDKGVRRLARGAGHPSPLHHEVAVVPGIQVAAGLWVVHMLPVEFLVTGFPLGEGWQRA